MHHDLALWVRLVALVMAIAGLAIAGKRIVFLTRLITAGQPAPDRIKGVTGRLGLALKTQLVEVVGQKKLLKWSVPGAAHASVFYAFVILGTVYVEAFGILISGNAAWHIPLVGEWAVLGFAQDAIALLALVGIVAFWRIRMKNSPARLGRDSRFFKSKLFGAYLVLFLIFTVIWTMFLFRGAASALGNLPYESGAFASIGVGNLLDGLGEGTLETLEGIGLLLHIGVMFVFLIEVVNSKHLHVFIAPVNVLFGRRPKALGAVKPLMNAGKPVTLDDVDDLDEDSKLGVGAVEDFSWKGTLDFATCTECGRCQSQCPAWNTEKPLSPKLLIMALRDASYAKGPHTIAPEGKREALLEGNDTLVKEVERPLVGDTADDWFYMPENGAGVIDPDVLWSCVTCGACVEQCPVDIEHVDHIVDMRRYQVLVENNFPAELNGLFKGMESRGNPWNLSPNGRLDWAKDLDVEVKVVGDTIESLDEVEWLFWVGCAGAYEDRAKKTTRAVAELLDMAGVSFGVLGTGETCTGDSARRAGNEFLFQGLAQQNVETFKEYKVKKVVSTCAHCFNTLKNEYSEFGIELDVVHHTQLLNRLVREGKLTPVAEGAGAHKRSITYHDPCYIGRHNGVYSPPRELLQVLPGASYVEMERNSERSFCCGAGGARMWMEETIGQRINNNRTEEAVGTGADQIAVGCPFCRVMLDDGLTAKQSNGEAREEVEVLDVAQMLLASVKGTQATKLLPGEGATRTATPAPAAKARDDEPGGEGDPAPAETTVKEADQVGPLAKASGGAGSSLFEDPAAAAADAKATDPADQPAAKPASSGGSLFDTPAETPAAKPASSGGSLFDTPADKPAEKPAEKPASGGSLFDTPADKPADKPAETPAASGGSLFDIGGDDKQAEQPAKAEQPAEKPAETPAETPVPKDDPSPVASSGGSLFDIPASTAEPKAEAAAPAVEEPKAAEAPKAEAPAPTSSIGSGSLFDIAAPAAAEPAATEPEAEPEPEPEADAEQAPEPEPEKKPAPPSSNGSGHQPRTDADISGSSSLFDL